MAAQNPTKTENHLLLACAFTIYILALSLGNITVFASTQKQTVSTRSLEEELNYWKRVIYTHPDYRDGYLEIAKIEALLGNKKEAQQALNNAQNKNPNSNKVENLKNVLGVWD